LKGRLLVLVSELDENVLPGSTLQFIDALAKAGKDAELLFLVSRNHNTGRTPNTIRRIEDYFVRHLLQTAPPDWNRDGPP
jgi:dipeptidyl aminopeptidase/acylaminoacyl peptidase